MTETTQSKQTRRKAADDESFSAVPTNIKISSSASSCTHQEVKSLADSVDDSVKIVPPPSSWYSPPRGKTETASKDRHIDKNENDVPINAKEDQITLKNETKTTETSVISSTNTTSLTTQTTKIITDSIQKQISTMQNITTQILPPLAQELISASAYKAYHYTKISYSESKLFGKFYLQNTEVGNKMGGYDRSMIQKEGIRDQYGNLLWKEGMLLQNGNDAEHQKESNVRDDALIRKGIPNGPAWEDEWDKQRLLLPPFSSLSWVDRQLVKEWRTFDYLNQKEDTTIQASDGHEELEEDEFDQARKLLPQPIQKPPWENANSCYACRRKFGATLRHHCRLCGRSYCQAHSRWSHRLPHLGYSPDVPERVCAPCKQVLESQNLAERIAWRMARCRDYLEDGLNGKSKGKNLTPYFETGVDTVEDRAARLTKAAIHMAKSIPLGAQATMTVETLDVLRKHGLKGVYGLILRKEFMAAADLLCKVTGINKKVWPLSVHELSAAIFYALAQHRALRGVDPEREHRIHTLKHEHGAMIRKESKSSLEGFHQASSDNDIEASEGKEPKIFANILVDETDNYDPTIETEENILENGDERDNKSKAKHSLPSQLPFEPVCTAVTDSLLSSLIFYAPLALNFIYATSEVDMQILAAQQGWRLLYAHLKQDDGTWGGQVADKPASAFFIHSEQKIACFAIRGTASINDVVTDIRAMPVQFPDNEMDGVHRTQSKADMSDDDWTPISKGQGLALCGMAGAAYNLFRENIDAILLLARQGYRIRLTGHSLGGSVAALLGALVKRHFEFNLPKKFIEDKETMRVYSYGSPACVDAKLADYAQSYVTNCVLHDDVIPRLTPTSIRALLKHLLYIRETWVKAHLNDDLMAITERAKTAWAPKLRNGFSLIHASNPSVKVYKKVKAKGKKIKQKIKKGGKKLKSLASGSTKLPTKEQSEDEDMETPIPLHIRYDESNLEDETDQEQLDDSESKLFFEGDCFYEAEESLIEHSDDESVVDDENKNDISCDKSLGSWVPFDEDVPFDEPQPSKPTGTKKESQPVQSNESPEDSSPSANPIFLEETPLPRMFIPGKIVHIYTHRGAYKATQVPKAFRELRRISLAGNMLNDHMSKNYYEALLECKSVRQARKSLPEWTGFSEAMTCSCCASKFTWASTSDSEAQEARDRHNCRACGSLVCAPCSTQRIAVPDIGINVPLRVCDRCYHDMGRVLSDSISCDSQLASRTPAVSNDGDRFTNAQKQTSKRISLVDELVMKMPSAAVS